MSQGTITTEHADLFDGLSAIAVERRARVLRARATADALSQAWTGVWTAIQRGYGAITRGMQNRRLVNELSQLDDRLLADVGLNRTTLAADLKRGREAEHVFVPAPLTGKALLFPKVVTKVPANSDTADERRVA
ncbi:MAG: DUF1127 domain-containing protein [Pseudomonadota bacterium]